MLYLRRVASLEDENGVRLLVFDLEMISHELLVYPVMLDAPGLNYAFLYQGLAINHNANQCISLSGGIAQSSPCNLFVYFPLLRDAGGYKTMHVGLCDA